MHDFQAVSASSTSVQAMQVVVPMIAHARSFEGERCDVGGVGYAGVGTAGGSDTYYDDPGLGENPPGGGFRFLAEPPSTMHQRRFFASLGRTTPHRPLNLAYGTLFYYSLFHLPGTNPLPVFIFNIFRASTPRSMMDGCFDTNSRMAV